MSKNKSGKPTVKELMARPQKYIDPEDLLSDCYDYFAYCDQNPWYQNDFIRNGKQAGEIVALPTSRPYTKQGLFNFLLISRNTWNNYKEKGDKFLTVITHVEQKIEANQLEGAQVGAYNANIVARLLGLTDKQDVSMGGREGENTEPIKVEVVYPDNNQASE